MSVVVHYVDGPPCSMADQRANGQECGRPSTHRRYVPALNTATPVCAKHAQAIDWFATRGRPVHPWRQPAADPDGQCPTHGCASWRCDDRH